MISVQAPGKLYIAGEYAVVESGYPAIIVAVDQFVTVSVENSEDVGSLISTQYQETPIVWRREGDEMVFDDRDNPFQYILSAIRLTESYAREIGRKMTVYHMKIDSDLDSPDGKKYGLGSSAAVTVATIKALNEFYQLGLKKAQLFKLAAIAHLDIQGNGSLGDIAASVYGGWMAYQSFDHDWLASERHLKGLPELINEDWPGLSIELLTPPDKLELLIGWTGSPASTSHLVDRVAVMKAEQPDHYQAFLNQSKQCINRLVTGFRTNQLPVIQREITVNRRLLKKLADFSHVVIETPVLTKMCDIAERFGGAAKSSGAGGGDCGIVIINKDQDINTMVKEWSANGIKRLKMNVHHVLGE
ncbi:phosphomevalonate kinase [Levilactobacillus bambusae]|uniref:phosphomevalonate kinase n=1 Tax=Levilactobacillus bambusae TaxID=2024736 RepID=A0A2V1N5W8_9LACO|nr:phosphomevalonate kinase [Levilactobacillus bambusae]PWG01115.1 phosphomevalonate kinase [Levilactobacillus bambusae]